MHIVDKARADPDVLATAVQLFVAAPVHLGSQDLDGRQEGLDRSGHA